MWMMLRILIIYKISDAAGLKTLSQRSKWSGYNNKECNSMKRCNNDRHQLVFKSIQNFKL
jgi:hypothetical protein